MELNAKSETAYYQNLIDAGCSEKVAKQCIALLKENRISEMLRIIALYRVTLLDKVHIQQKQIDCLDFFTYQIKKINQ